MNKWFLSPAWSRRCLRAHNIGSLCHSLHRPKASLYGRIFARSYGKVHRCCFLPSLLALTARNLEGLGGPKPLRTLQTLDATRLSRSDFVDLSKVTRAILYGQNVKTQRSAIDYITTGTHHHPFPENTHGFFYFVPAPHTSVQLASEVRFRITRHDHPSSFTEGSDLLFPDGTPWRIPLAYLARGSGCSYLRDLLLQGQLVTSSSLSHCVSLPHRVDSKSRIIHSIGQIFSLNLKDLRPTVYFATEHSLHHKHLEPFLDRRRAKPKAPYAGKSYKQIKGNFIS